MAKVSLSKGGSALSPLPQKNLQQLKEAKYFTYGPLFFSLRMALEWAILGLNQALNEPSFDLVRSSLSQSRTEPSFG